MSRGPFHILVVDDEPVMRHLLRDLLRMRGHCVRTAADGREALSVVCTESVDMVISDIQMPEMDGFTLLSVLEAEYPSIRRVLMTGCEIDGYLGLIREYNIGNVLSKGGDFHLEEIASYIDRLLCGTVFGLGPYFEGEASDSVNVFCQDDCERACSRVLSLYRGADRVFLEMALNELVSNAVFHGVLRMSGVPRERWSNCYRIGSRDPVKVTWMSDDEKVGIGVEDPVGALSKKDVLRWLDHPIGDENPGEEHGRGLMLVRRLIDRLIINIDPGVRTECIVLQYHERRDEHRKKPLLIHEL